MTTALYLLGAPGAGKSTAMSWLLQDWNAGPLEDLDRLMKGHRILSGDLQRQGVYLGVLRDAFPGTDGLGMAVAPDAVRWALHEAKKYDVVLGEGARLGIPKFLVALDCYTDLTVALLDAPDELLVQRREKRGSGQKEVWARGAATRARNAADAAEAAGVRVIRVDATLPKDEVAAILEMFC